jgi:glutamate 5-kinase
MAGDTALEAWRAARAASIGKGGMITKVLAAKRAASRGRTPMVASGRVPDVLVRLAAGEAIGTQFIAVTPRLAARKQWLADHLQLRGSVTPGRRGRHGAERRRQAACCRSAWSRCSGEFERGEVVGLPRPATGREIARGLINYSSAETRLIMRKASSEIESILGFIEEPELIHRDNLVLR